MALNLNETIHFFLLILTLSIPIYSKKALQYLIYIPFLISLSWVIFDGCIITNANSKSNSDKKSKSFVHSLLRIIYPDIKLSVANNFLVALFIFITLLCYIRIHYF